MTPERQADHDAALAGKRQRHGQPPYDGIGIGRQKPPELAADDRRRLSRPTTNEPLPEARTFPDGAEQKPMPESGGRGHTEVPSDGGSPPGTPAPEPADGGRRGRSGGDVPPPPPPRRDGGDPPPSPRGDHIPPPGTVVEIPPIKDAPQPRSQDFRDKTLPKPDKPDKPDDGPAGNSDKQTAGRADNQADARGATTKRPSNDVGRPQTPGQPHRGEEGSTKSQDKNPPKKPDLPHSGTIREHTIGEPQKIYRIESLDNATMDRLRGHVARLPPDQRDKALAAEVDQAFQNKLNDRDRGLWATPERHTDLNAAYSENSILPVWHADAAVVRQYEGTMPAGTTRYESSARPIRGQGSDPRGYGAQIYFPRDLPENRGVDLRWRQVDLNNAPLNNRARPPKKPRPPH